MSCLGHERRSGFEYAASFDACVKMSFTKLFRMADVMFGARKKEYAASY